MGVLVAIMVVVPAAIAWACNPQANISVNQGSYSPGQTMTVYGSYFPGNASITVTSPTGSKTVTTSSGGAFSTTFAVPSRPGSYVVSATRPTGGSASASFSVAAPAPARAQAPAPTGTPGTGTAAPRAPSFDAPSVVRSKRQRSTAGTGSGGNGPNAPATTGRSGSGVVSQGGTTVFSGSAPAAAPTASGGTFAAAPATATAGAPARAAAKRSSAARNPAASEQSATGYAWSGFAPGRTPSLTSATSMAPESGSGSGLGLGIGLLALGLVALVGGLTAAEMRRRRALA